MLQGVIKPIARGNCEGLNVRRLTAGPQEDLDISKTPPPNHL